MSLQEMRDDIDLTFNYEHSQHATPFANATLDTFYVALPTLDANGNVTEADAIATYNAFETNLEKLLASVDDDMNLAKNFSIKLPEAGAKSGNDIEVVFTRMSKDTQSTFYRPFELGDDYIWAYSLGRCDHDSTVRITDAANELTRKIHHKSPAARYDAFVSAYNINYVDFTPYRDSYYLEDYIYIEREKYPLGNIYWLFLTFGEYDEEPCVYYHELNWAYNNFNETHISSNGQYHYHPKNGLPYYDCMILPRHLYSPDSVKRSVRFHYAKVVYATPIIIDETDN